MQYKSLRQISYPVNKVHNRSTRRTCKSCSKLTIKTPEYSRWRPKESSRKEKKNHYKVDFPNKFVIKWKPEVRSCILEKNNSLFSLFITLSIHVKRCKTFVKFLILLLLLILRKSKAVAWTCSKKKFVLKNFIKIQRKILCRSLFLD